MTRFPRIAPVFFLTLAFGCTAPPLPAPPDVSARTVTPKGVLIARLSNGLTVLVAENHNAPVVCVQAGVRAGGLYEGKYLGAGISHLVEHLVAEGAEHAPAGGGAGPAVKTKSTRVDRIGGQSNAFTWLDDTNYYIAATSGKTDDCIDLVADWMARAKITPEDFQREHGVVQRELEMGRDNPRRQLAYAHAANVYGTHPAAVPVIGWQAPLAGLKLTDVLDYHGRMYVPQNMVVVVVGDVSAEKVLDRARRAFAGQAPGRVPDLTLPEVAPVASTRRLILPNPAVTQDEEQLSFLTIPLVHPDLYALDILSFILTEGDSSRLADSIKRKQRLVTGIASSSWTPAWGKGEFTIHFRCAAGSADRAEKAVLDELKKVAEGGVSEEELARAKRQKAADFVYSQQTVESQANTLVSDYLATGDAEFSRQYTEKIQKVTAGEVAAAAKKYFNFDAMVSTRMVPSGSPGARAATQATTRPPAATFTLPNGLRVVLRPDPSLDLVSMALVERGGVLLEKPDTNGLGTMMTALSTRGAGARTAEQISAFFDGAGGSLNARCGHNTFYWQATVLSDSFAQALPIFADVVVRPTFPAGELDILRPILLARIRQIDEDWYGVLNHHFKQDFFRDSPLALLPDGAAKVVSSGTRAALGEYHSRNVKAGSSVLTIYGRFDPESARSAVEKLFADMPAGEVKTPQVAPRQVARGGETYTHRAAVKGAGVMVGAPGMLLTNLADAFPMTVLDTIISGYQLPRGWLHDELRGKELVYVVHAYNWAGLAPGAFLAYAQCEPDKVQEVTGVIRADLDKTKTYPFSGKEIDEAVNIILTAELLDKQDVPAVALQAALDELYGFGYDFRNQYERRLRAVTPADLNRVAKKYFSAGYVTDIVLPQAPGQAPATRPAPAESGEQQ